MGKLIKMQGVSGHPINPVSKNRQNSTSGFSFIDLIAKIIAIPIFLIVIIYKILIQFPSNRSLGSHFLGLFRVCFWGYLFQIPDHESLFRSVFSEYSQPVQLSYPLFTVITLL